MADARLVQPSPIRDVRAAWLRGEAAQAERDIDRLVHVLAGARKAREDRLYRDGYDTGYMHGTGRRPRRAGAAR